MWWGKGTPKLKLKLALVGQVEDLAVASPATVSRAGMVYLDVDEMGWKPFVASWLQQRREIHENFLHIHDPPPILGRMLLPLHES